MNGLRTSMSGLIAMVVLGAIGWAVLNNPDKVPFPINTGRPQVRQPVPTASDGTWMYVTVSWEQGRTAAVSITAGGRPVPPATFFDEGGGAPLGYCDVVCTASPSKWSVQVKRGDLVILSVVATAGWGRVFCSLRRVNERDSQLVKPAKMTGLEGEVVCRQTAR